MFNRRNKTKLPPIARPIGVRVGVRSPMIRVDDVDEIEDRFKELDKAPGFIVPREVAQDLGEDIFDLLTRVGRGVPSGQDIMYGTPAGVESPLHTDHSWLVPACADVRLHQVTSDHRSVVNIGRLVGRGMEFGMELREVDYATPLQIPTMLVGEVGQGDVTVFRLSKDVAHRFSEPDEGWREYRFRTNATLPVNI